MCSMLSVRFQFLTLFLITKTLQQKKNQMLFMRNYPPSFIVLPMTFNLLISRSWNQEGLPNSLSVLGSRLFVPTTVLDLGVLLGRFQAHY